MKSSTLKNSLFLLAALAAGTFAATLIPTKASAEAPRLGSTTLLQTVDSQTTINIRDAIPMAYDLYVAEPSELKFVLEFRYLDTRYQEGTDWAVYTMADSEEDLDDAILWIALHLVAEWRVVERWTEPEWFLFNTYSDRDNAETDAAFFESFGMLTYIEARSLLNIRYAISK